MESRYPEFLPVVLPPLHDIILYENFSVIVSVWKIVELCVYQHLIPKHKLRNGAMSVKVPSDLLNSPQ